MNWSLSLVITLAVCMAICIIAVMMTLGGMGVTSSIGRTMGFAAATAIGFILGQYVHKNYVAK